ncbi:MAG: TetR/AcrR family transcriptional regulator C-terminal domain-containing protein [Eubacteriales bacterium]|nr:TetR/AcrR family transcriptional regulator C-terminal domain-containing protein [Eubacteriales bacterium]
MADSNITKRALAAALRELMEQMPFDKIQVGQICELCDMNRKSFYYHFKDKYDLLNWIFDVEFLTFVQRHSRAKKTEQRIESIRDMCHYFYENRDFYRKALKIQGQNSFSEHFREYIMLLIKSRFSELFGDREDDFELNFFTDAVVCAMERWLLDKECMPPDEFVDRLLQLICQGADVVHQQLNEDTE